MKLIYGPRTVTIKGSYTEIGALLSDGTAGADHKNAGISGSDPGKMETATRARLYMALDEQLNREDIEYIQERGL